MRRTALATSLTDTGSPTRDSARGAIARTSARVSTGEVDIVEPGATLVERLARIVRDLCLAQRSGDVVRDYLEWPGAVAVAGNPSGNPVVATGPVGM